MIPSDLPVINRLSMFDRGQERDTYIVPYYHPLSFQQTIVLHSNESTYNEQDGHLDPEKVQVGLGEHQTLRLERTVKAQNRVVDARMPSLTATAQ